MRLTPLRESCLRALDRGSLKWTEQGWVPINGDPGCWNSLTLYLLERAKLAQRGRARSDITADGRRFLRQMDMGEAA